MKSRKPRFPSLTSAEDIAWMDARMSKYPVNLFSTYGVRCNTSDDIAHWRRCANEVMPESACQLGLAYLDGNGAAVDIAEAGNELLDHAARRASRRAARAQPAQEGDARPLEAASGTRACACVAAGP
jgi:hypothetical protein